MRGQLLHRQGQDICRDAEFFSSTTSSDFPRSLLARCSWLYSPHVQAVHNYREHKDVAAYIKVEFDTRYIDEKHLANGAYHCIVGRHYTSTAC